MEQRAWALPLVGAASCWLEDCRLVLLLCGCSCEFRESFVLLSNGRRAPLLRLLQNPARAGASLRNPGRYGCEQACTTQSDRRKAVNPVLCFSTHVASYLGTGVQLKALAQLRSASGGHLLLDIRAAALDTGWWHIQHCRP